jgi:hypothetical protein
MPASVRAAGLLAALLIASPAMAESVDTPECRRDLFIANQHIEAVAKREDSVKRGDIDGLCRVLRQNLQDMVEAREPMNRCLIGHAHGENVGQMDASIEDIRFILANRCRR